MSYKESIAEILETVQVILDEIRSCPEPEEQELIDWGYKVMKTQKAAAKEQEDKMKDYYEYDINALELKEEQDKTYAYSRATGFLYNTLEDLHAKMNDHPGATDFIAFIEAALLQVDKDLEAL